MINHESKVTKTTYSLGEHDEAVSVLKGFFLVLFLLVGGAFAGAYIAHLL